MKTRNWQLLTLALVLTACGGQKKLTQYDEIYKQRPATIYVAPVDDQSPHRAVRETKDSVYNASLSIAAKQLYLTAADPLVAAGYYVLGPLASAQIAATENRSRKQMLTDRISDYSTDLGVDAVLFIDILKWSSTSNSWTAELHYVLRSTITGGDLMNVTVNATKFLPTDHKGNPKPLSDDLRLQKHYGCDLETAQRCRLVEIVNKYVLSDLPGGERARTHDAERYIPSHPDFFYLRIQRDGSVEMFTSDQIEK